MHKQQHISGAEKNHLARGATILAVSVALTITGAKFFAWMHSGSLALLSSFVDSIFDVSSSLINLVALKYSHKPADDDHRFGHGKAEAIASFTQGLIITGVSIYIIVNGLLRIHEPKQLVDETIGLIVMGFSVALTVVLVSYQRYVFKKTKSLLVKSDSLHYVGDLLTNFAVIASLALSRYYQNNIADSIIAVLIAVFMIYGGFTIIMESLNHLMDKELSESEREEIISTILSHPEVNGFHDLRTRRSGSDLFIQVHIEMDGNLPLVRAHHISDDVEGELRKLFPDATILTHLDVEREKPQS